MRTLSPATSALTLFAVTLALALAVPAAAEEALSSLCTMASTEHSPLPIAPAVEIGLAQEPREQQLCFCPKDFGADPYIAQGWACATSCSAATSACETDAYNKAGANCFYGVCYYGSLTYRPVSGCIYDHSMCPGKYLRDCDLEYWCQECEDIPN